LLIRDWLIKGQRRIPKVKSVPDGGGTLYIQVVRVVDAPD